MFWIFANNFWYGSVGIVINLSPRPTKWKIDLIFMVGVYYEGGRTLPSGSPSGLKMENRFTFSHF